MNDSTLALLALVAELDSPSGYRVAAVARARGMERWAGLSMSSVYKGLHQLEALGFLQTATTRQKVGRGPPGRWHVVTSAGSRALRKSLFDALLEAPEQSVRYRLSLAFIEVVGRPRATAQLERRLRLMNQRIAEVERARADTPLGASLVFEYVLHGLRQELVATRTLMGLLKGQATP